MSNEHNNAPAVSQGIPAQEVIDAIEAWKSAWLKVPPFADRVNKATREAITISHNSLFLLLQSAQQAQRMPAGCPTPTGCGPHGCHGDCIAATPAPAPAQEPVDMVPRAALHEVGLTDDDKQALQVMRWLNSGEWALTRSQPSSYLTDEANAERAWFVERKAIPYCDKNGHRRWFGCTAFEAFTVAIAAFRAKGGV